MGWGRWVGAPGKVPVWAYRVDCYEEEREERKTHCMPTNAAYAPILVAYCPPGSWEGGPVV